MAYRPIFDTFQLPEPGPLPEDLRFDMKMMLAKPIDAGALAGDVAAFANTAGGVLLIGAKEDPNGSGILSDYEPMPYSEAVSLGTALKNALRLCSPKPIAEAKIVALDASADKFVVAINCDPYAAPPIGVARPNEKGGEKFWCFPARRGRDNHNLRPEELATIMEPRLRRMLLLLDRIPLYEPQHRRRARFHTPAEAVYMDILSIDMEASSIRLVGLQRPFELVLPVDAVLMIWQDVESQMFQVSIDGRIQETSVGYNFIPKR